jgi:hypothetical protein
VAAPVEGDGLAFDRRRKTTRVIHSMAECTRPKDRWGRFRWETEKNGGGPHEGLGRNQRIKKNRMFKWFQIYLGFKNQRIQNIFKLKFELGYTKINLNKLFGDFSNLEYLEIDLNNQI